MIPSRSPPWHYTTFWDWLDHWQTLIAGVLAVLAAWRTIRATVRSADREIEASQAQTAVAQKQIETTVRLERERVLSEDKAFRVMLEAAMARIIAEADWAKETYPQYVGQAQGASIDVKDASRDALRAQLARLIHRMIEKRGSRLAGSLRSAGFAMPGQRPYSGPRACGGYVHAVSDVGKETDRSGVRRGRGV